MAVLALAGLIASTTVRGHGTITGSAPELPAVPPRGWYSGGVSQGASFATWRGAPIDSLSTWSDTDATQVLLPQLHQGGDAYRCRCLLDVAIGAIDKGETWKAAARGAYDERWRTSLRNLRGLRAGLGPTFIRFAHEMNGNWFPWSVHQGEAQDFIRAWKRFRAIQIREFPESFLVFSPNKDSSGSSVPWTDLFPGAHFVDAMGVDLLQPSIRSSAQRPKFGIRPWT